MGERPRTRGCAALLALLAALHGAPSAEAAVVLCGDVTGNGQVDLGDALAIAQYDVDLRASRLASI